MQTLAPPYEVALRNDSRWALNEAGKYFEDRAKVQITLKKIARRLNDLNIDYAIVGGMALTHHGFVRFTNDVDIVVTRESNAELHSRLEGLGYLPPFEKSKNLRDTDSGVKIEFLITGEFPVKYPRSVRRSIPAIAGQRPGNVQAVGGKPLGVCRPAT